MEEETPRDSGEEEETMSFLFETGTDSKINNISNESFAGFVVFTTYGLDRDEFFYNDYFKSTWSILKIGIIFV